MDLEGSIPFFVFTPKPARFQAYPASCTLDCNEECMARYLLKRRDDDEVADIASRYGGRPEAARSARMDELVRFRAAQGPMVEALEWIRDTDAALAPTPPSLTPMLTTGFCVVDLAPGSAERLRADLPAYEVIEDRPMAIIHPVDSRPSPVPHADAPWRWTHEMMGIRGLRDRGLSGQGVRVAVLDTGVDGGHPELAGKVDSAVRLYALADKLTWVREPVSEDTDTEGGHGTHVAGLIAGNDVGVAPQAKLSSCVMFPNRLASEPGNITNFVAALEWVAKECKADPELRVVNMSAGLLGFKTDIELLTIVRRLVDICMVVPVFAIGNDGRNRTRSPGNYDVPLSVGACDKRRRIAPFSGGGVIHCENHAFTVPDLVAPGVDVYSCAPGGRYVMKDGTSMAAPFVSGVAALLLERYPAASPHDIIDAILCTTVDLGCPRDRQGGGLIEPTAALEYLKGSLADP